jgi:hypothetical protein
MTVVPPEPDGEFGFKDIVAFPGLRDEEGLVNEVPEEGA